VPFLKVPLVLPLSWSHQCSRSFQITACVRLTDESDRQRLHDASLPTWISWLNDQTAPSSFPLMHWNWMLGDGAEFGSAESLHPAGGSTECMANGPPSQGTLHKRTVERLWTGSNPNCLDSPECHNQGAEETALKWDAGQFGNLALPFRVVLARHES